MCNNIKGACLTSCVRTPDEQHISIFIYMQQISMPLISLLSELGNLGFCKKEKNV